MTKIAIAAATFVLAGMLLARHAAADEHEQMRAAQHELKIVKQHLKDAPKDYEGHRKEALDYVDKALEQVRLGLNLTKKDRE
jgi:Ni/Co efflux regulator RcnB